MPGIGRAEETGPTVEVKNAPPDQAVYGLELTEEQQKHWSFRTPVAHIPPAIEDSTGWIRNSIDAFILEALRKAGLEPSPPADDRVWLRRVYFDLIGLPPSPEEVDAFLADKSPDARARMVDRLLADPGYGIRWGRRWLDVVRYADTNGYERDGDKPNAWRYRDYVIDSFNADKPYFRFLTEQLAGDELDDSSAETLIATTFLRLGTWDDEPADPMIDRYDQLDDIVRSVSSTFLGLTVGCARCHNHKFEPLSQIDYARMVAFFEPLKRPQNGRADLDVPVGRRGELERYEAFIKRSEAATRAVQEQIKVLDDAVRERYLLDFAAANTKLSREAFEAHRTVADKRDDNQKRLVKDTYKRLLSELKDARTADERKQREQFEAALKTIESGNPRPLPRGYIWEEPSGELPVTQVFRRGDPTTPAGAVPPGFPSVLGGEAAVTPSTGDGSRTSRRRLALAQWMAEPQHPLAARVAVNRVWQGHFGEGLVATENDFGVMGNLPSHPELLDWLVAHFLQSGGSLKALHRLIVLSGTYAQQSTSRESAAKIDPSNERLWRFPYRRLDAEVVRDSVLAVNGRLNSKMAGPGVYPKIATEVLAGQSRPGSGWGSFDEAEASRRAAYIFVKRSLLVPEMELLDFADTTASCEQRSVSTIPTQALTLMNGEFTNQQARFFAERIRREVGDEPQSQVERAYRLAFGRAPDPDEALSSLRFLERQRAELTRESQAEGKPLDDVPRLSLQALCLVLYNLNEFVYVD